MKLVYTDHALKRLRERGITKMEVRIALVRGKKSDAEEGLRQCRYRTQKGTLVVMYNIHDVDEVKIITAYRQ